MAYPALKIDDLWFKYPSYDQNRWTLSSVSLSLGQGELIGLLGPSGCGKTTLLRLIAGFEKPARGTIRIHNNSVATPDYLCSPERRGVGMVFQDYALFPHLDLWKNVCFGLKKGQDKHRAKWLLELLGLYEFRFRYPHQLSGGQRQRLALARALAPGNSLVVLDEPFSNLDVEVRHKLRSQLSDVLSSCGASGILVTHDPEEALAICNRVAVMSDGQLHQCSTPTEIVHKPKTSFVASFVLQRNVLPVNQSGVELYTPLGNLRSPHDEDISNPKQLILDEHCLTVTEHPEGNAIVKGLEFHGTHWHLRVKLDEFNLRVWQPLDNTLKIGDSCFVNFRSNEYGLLFPGCIHCPLN